MKSYNEIENEVALIISEVTGNLFDNISEKQFYEDMGFDSVSIIELLVSIEERYDILLLIRGKNKMEGGNNDAEFCCINQRCRQS